MINRATFIAAVTNVVIFASDLKKAAIETVAPNTNMTGDIAAVSSMSLSARIIELILLLINEIDTSNTNMIVKKNGS